MKIVPSWKIKIYKHYESVVFVKNKNEKYLEEVQKS